MSRARTLVSIEASIARAKSTLNILSVKTSNALPLSETLPLSLSIPEVGAILRMHPINVRKLCAYGRLDWCRGGPGPRSRIWVTLESVLAYRTSGDKWRDMKASDAEAKRAI